MPWSRDKEKTEIGGSHLVLIGIIMLNWYQWEARDSTALLLCMYLADLINIV